MLEKMRPIIAEQLNVQESEIKENTKLKEDLGADSLDLFELVMALEEEFGVEIPSEDLESIVTVGDVITYLKKHGNKGKQIAWNKISGHSGRYGMGGGISPGGSGVECGWTRNHRGGKRAAGSGKRTDP